MDYTDQFRRHSAQQQEAQAVRERIFREWIEDYQHLLHDIHGWLTEATREGLLFIHEISISIQEESLESYSLPCLVIENPITSTRMEVVPIGCMIVGAHGRVDLRTRGVAPIILIRPVEGEGWLVRQKPNGQYPLTRETFQILLLTATQP